MLYKITFNMQTPIVISDPLHLDALLMAVHPDARCITEVNRNIRDDALLQLEIPIAKASCGMQWIWCASSIELDEGAKPYGGHYKKSLSPDDVHYLQKSVMTVGGIHKNKVARVSGYIATQAMFLAESNDPAQLEFLCRRVTNIGKLRGMGYGVVKSCEVSPQDASWKTCLVQNGRAMRNLPARFVQEDAHEQIISQPPYWGAYRREDGVSPGNSATLREDVYLCSYVI